MPSIEKSVMSRIESRGRGACFTPKAFLDLGSPGAVRIALHRLERRGAVRRLARGLYEFPKHHPTIGLLSPHPDEVAKALSERDASRLQPSGACAANTLGLSEHVPARVVFLTDGPARHVRVGRQTIILKHTTPRNMATSGSISGTVIQALRHIGPRQINEHHIARIRRVLSADDRAQLRRDRMHAPGWMHHILDVLAEDSRA